MAADVETVSQAAARELGDEREQREGETGGKPLVPPGTLHVRSVPDGQALVQTRGGPF
jgi:hypothetical protein